jgi:translation initiation factor 2A
LKNDCRVVTSIEKPRTSYLKFSPLGTYFTIWETFHISKDDQKESSNLNIYETITGKLIKSMVKKKLENFVQWSNDEKVFCMLNAVSEICFFEATNPDVFVCKIKQANLTSFNMSPVSKCIAVHSTGKKSEPSSIRLYQYPNVSNVVANKSFFNSDHVDFKWNKSGNNLLLLCSTETSQSSYYGDTTLHQMTSASSESQLIQLSKKGPIYSFEWSPLRDEFVVVYGTMPAKATLFNSKSEAIYDFGTGPRNECHYNAHGNILCLAGFGNLSGKIEVWNMNTPNRVPLQISTIQADDTTYFEWCPDGEHILTSTTAPRLRVSNGFKIWNFMSDLKYTYKLPPNNELWQVQWQPGTYKKKATVAKKVITPVVKEEG